MNPDAAALVLAGGLSQRLGRNKALVPFRGEPLLAILCRQLLDQFPQVAVVAKTPSAYESIVPAGVTQISDTSPDLNPLVGIESGLSWTNSEELFVVACDMPFGARPAVVQKLREALGDQDAAAYTWKGFPEPLCAFYRREACLPLVRALAAAGRGPRHVLAAVRTRLVAYEATFPEDPLGVPFLDVDTPEDLERLASRDVSGSLPL